MSLWRKYNDSKEYLMEFEIREAVMSDAEAIYILNRNELGYDYPLEQTKEKLANLPPSKTDKWVLR